MTVIVTRYRLVTEVTYDQECDNIVQHVCEELYHVPVPVRHVPVPVRHVPVPLRHVSKPVTPRPIFGPAPGSRIPRSSQRLRGVQETNPVINNKSVKPTIFIFRFKSNFHNQTSAKPASALQKTDRG